MRRLALFIGMITLLGVVVAAPATAAGPDRYQTKTATWTITLLWDGWTYVHYFDLAFNPCDNTLAGTGHYEGYNGLGAYTETVAGSIDPKAGTVHWRADTTLLVGGVPFWWTSDGDLTPTGFGNGGGIDSMGRYFTPITGVESNAVVSTWKNHGEYVKAMGGGADAAHSCIGMPIVPK